MSTVCDRDINKNNLTPHDKKRFSYKEKNEVLSRRCRGIHEVLLSAVLFPRERLKRKGAIMAVGTEPVDQVTYLHCFEGGGRHPLVYAGDLYIYTERY